MIVFLWFLQYVTGGALRCTARAYSTSSVLFASKRIPGQPRVKKEKRPKIVVEPQVPEAERLAQKEAAARTAAILASSSEAQALAAGAAQTKDLSDMKVGDPLPEPEAFPPQKVRGIDERSLFHRIHSAVANRPYWGPHGAWDHMVSRPPPAPPSIPLSLGAWL